MWVDVAVTVPMYVCPTGRERRGRERERKHQKTKKHEKTKKHRHAQRKYARDKYFETITDVRTCGNWTTGAKS